MNQISDRPNVYTFGKDFNYTVWSAGTTLTLTNVPWGNDYKDLHGFKTHAELNTYLQTRPQGNHTIKDMTRLELGRPIKVNMTLNEALPFNYIRVTNPLMPISGDVKREYYYFILGVEYLSPQTTLLSVELDVWATFFTDIEFGNCHIERGHIGVANDRQMVNGGRDYLTVPEGLEIGSDYIPTHTYRKNIFIEGRSDYLITSAVSLVEPPGTKEDPLLSGANGTDIRPFSLPTESYVIKWEDLVPYMTQMAHYPWITQGIIEIVAIPRLTDIDLEYLPLPRTGNYPPGTGSNSYLHSAEFLNNLGGDIVVDDFRDVIRNKIPEKYRHLSKFLTSPYSVLQMTTNDANDVFFKPELFHRDKLTFEFAGTLMPGNTIFRMTPFNYNDEYDYFLNPGERRKHSCIYEKFPRMPILNDGAALALASSAHSTAQAYDAALWGRDRAYIGIENMRQNTIAGNTAMRAQNSLNQWGAGQQNDITNRYGYVNAVSGAVQGGIAGLAYGGPKGAAIGAGVALAGGAIQAGASHMQNNEMLAINNALASGTTGININQANTIYANNAAMASKVANGDYQSQVAALNARSRDIELTPPSVIGQLAGDFLKVLDGVSFWLTFKRLSDGDLARVGDYWLRYGYAVNQFVKPPKDLHVMTNFSYYKMAETYLVGHIPEFFKNAIRGIFERGTTIWRDPDLIGQIDISENNVLENIRY